ncbi:hypothetical protein PQ469_28220 [Mucilaginibacter sp. KACC 22773]|jgi:hypothetical protein|uniref:hypothetical protein n=1 Tax=Mucilaginibacter sp. KACC 22773 TaxID=3025671 RepID=UPI0023669044|nr:hypothetical protein [Mucilaginibacter sp. KACC 22773]WDF77776.1 hypothetical protein PQ469_28220 [Mucilaginibacter sp. KACC 22773]
MDEIIIGSIPLLIAFGVSLIRYKKLEPRWLRLFTYFLLATFLIQTVGYLYSALLKKSNHFIFNCYTLFEFEFLFVVFFKALGRKIFKNIVIFIALTFTLVYIYEVFIQGHFFIYSPFASNAGKFLTLLCCMLYLTELLMADEYVSFFRTPMFWIATGIMIAAVGDFLYLCFFDYIITNKLDPEGRVYGIITTSLSVIEYGFFTIGFLCKKTWIKNK